MSLQQLSALFHPQCVPLLDYTTTKYKLSLFPFLKTKTNQEPASPSSYHSLPKPPLLPNPLKWVLMLPLQVHLAPTP